MADYHSRITQEWRERAKELAQWVMTHLVNRTDVWGRYLPKRQRDDGDRKSTSVVTAPFRDERGKVFLTVSSLEKHFRARTEGGILGIHSSSADHTSRWLAIDIDRHDPDDLSVSPQDTFSAAHAWWSQLVDRGFDPLLFDSNGIGGYHILLVFATPMSTQSVHAYGQHITADFLRRGTDAAPEVFPGKPCWDHYGDWLRLPGLHHSRRHYTRVWNDEPWADEKWLDGHDAIDRILRTRLAGADLTTRHGIQPARRTVCLDFDGVIHSYRSGWCGADVIPDPPIHGAKEAISSLRRTFRVVVHSARCRTPEGVTAIEQWLQRHDIDVDEVCVHKPPAAVYVDDRAVPFRGDWDQAVAAIHDFRR